MPVSPAHYNLSIITIKSDRVDDHDFSEIKWIGTPRFTVNQH